MQNLTVQINGYYWHGLVSWTNYNAWNTNGCIGNQDAPSCQALWQTIQNQIGQINQQIRRRRSAGIPIQPSLDPDNLYQNFCTGNGTLDTVATVPINCQPLGQLVNNYLNRPDVQKAFHAKGPNGGPPLPWTECTSVINYNMSGASLVPLYAQFRQQKPGFNVLVYSGDVDIATVPFFYTQPCLGELNSKNVVPWQPWFVNGQTAGYWEQFQHPAYTFATIKGGGHEAPEYQPLSAFNMFQRYINTQSLVDPSETVQKFHVAHQKEHMRTQGQVLRDALRNAGLTP